MMKTIATVCAGLVALTLSAGALATVPDLLPIQGVLTDDLGTPIDAEVNIAFSLYDSESASTALWSDTFAVDVDQGFFTAYLGSSATLNFGALLTADEIWLGMKVGADPEMTRVRFASVPFAQEALVCEQVGSLTETDINTNFAAAVHDHDSTYSPTGHNHDSTYSPTGHDHDGTYVNVTGDTMSGSLVVGGTFTASSNTWLVGSENTGSVAALHVTSGSHNIYMDGNEFDAVNTTLYLQNNSAYGVDVNNSLLVRGDADVQGDVISTGNVTAAGGSTGAFGYTAAKTYYKLYAGVDFANNMTDSEWEYNELRNSLYLLAAENASRYVYAPVHLPQGADITAVFCYYADEDTDPGDDWENGQLELRAVDVTDGDIFKLADATFNAPATTTPYHLFWQDSSVSGAADPVNNSRYTYWLRVFMDKPTSASCEYDCIFYGCRITYTLTVVSQ